MVISTKPGVKEGGVRRLPPRLHPVTVLRRQKLASELFSFVKEIQRFENGYGFRFDRSDDLEDLLRKMAGYIVVESLNSPQLTFTIDEEPKTNSFWLQVRSCTRACQI